MNVRKWMSVVLICGVIAAPLCIASANDKAIRGTIVAAPIPTEEGATLPTIKNRTQAILSSWGPQVKERVQSGDLYIPKDTKITLQLIDSVNSKNNKKGDIFHLKVADNIIINNVIIIPKDTECTGTVIKANSNGIFGQGGNLEINIPSVNTLNALSVPLNGYVKGYGSNDNGAVAVAAVVSLIGGLFMHGENIYYNPGQMFQVTVKKDTDLLVTPDNLKELMHAPLSNGTSINVAAAL